MVKSRKQLDNKSGRRPKYKERMNVRTINMPDEMYQRLSEEAPLFGQSDASSMQRLINDWFFDAVDRQRGGTEAETKQEFEKVLATNHR